MSKTHYDTLGVSQNATQDQIRVAYHKLAKKFHPDANPGCTASELRKLSERMSEVSNAYSVLGDETSRIHYDALLAADYEGSSAYNSGYRGPRMTECEMCGHSPAYEATLRQNTGLILFRTHATYNIRACRGCGLFFSREIQNRTLLRGWWGIISFFSNVAAVFNNADAIKKFDALDDPIAPEDTVIRPLLEPSWQGAPLYRRLGIWVTCGLFLLLGFSIASGDTQSTSGSSGSSWNSAIPFIPPTTSTTKWTTNTCFMASDSSITQIVSCDGTEDGRVVAIVDSELSCPTNANKVFTEGFGDDQPGKTVCIELY